MFRSLYLHSNRAHLIKKSVKSGREQTYQNLEVIVVDDASTDDTEATVRNISDSRIKYIRLPRNSEACAARNEGIRFASGAHTAFNNSDDQWLPKKLQCQLNFLEYHNADVVICKMECKDTDGKFLHYFPNKSGSCKILYTDLLRYNCASTQTFFGRASCFKETLFDIKMPRLQDWDEALRLSKKYTMFFFDETLIHTFIQPDSITTHPEKGVQAMELIWKKHQDAISVLWSIAESFFKKKASFLCRAGKNPVTEMEFLAKTFPSVKNWLKYLLAQTELYRIIFFAQKQKIAYKTKLPS